MRLRLPQGNAVVLAVLGSPVHRLLSGLVLELPYIGRRGGREYVLPVQYVRAGDRVVVRPQAAQRTSWWSNFQTPGPVKVRLAGRMYHGTARVVNQDDPGWEQARSLYVSRWWRLEGRLTGPLVVIYLAHVAAHDLGAAAYAIRAIQASVTADQAEGARRRERDWQRAQIPAEVRELVLDDQGQRNDICWNAFAD